MGDGERGATHSVDDERWIGVALDEARAAQLAGEVPVGAVIVREGEVLARSGNQTVRDQDPTSHAEALVIRAAAATLDSWRLEGCTLYVTLEPCPMCAGAIVLARMPRVVYGAADPKAGAATTLFRLLDDPRLNHRAEVIGGVLAEPCGQILSKYFAGKRGGANR